MGGLVQLSMDLEVQAREQLQRIRQHWHDFWTELKDFHDEQRWVSLGYTSFKACVESELGLTERRAYQVLEAAAVAVALGTEKFFSTNHPNESQARALLPLKDEPEQLAAAWEEAQEVATEQGKAKPTAALVRDVVERVVERKEAKSHAQAHEERLAASEAQPLVLAEGEPFDQIVQSDALSFLRDRRSGSVDVCITSPPYWAKRTYTNGDPCELGQERDPADYVDRLCEIVNEIGRVLKPDGCLFLNVGDTLASQPGQYRGDPNRRRGISNQAIRANATAPAERAFDVEAEKTFCLIPESVVMRLVLDYGWRLAGKVVWHKVGYAPENVYDRLTQAWEPVYVLTRARHAYFRREPDGIDERPNDVWAIPVGRAGEAKGHLAPFPERLVERAIKHACRPDGVVLDPFAGSGTVLRVAKSLGRRFLGCDLMEAALPLELEAAAS